MIVTSKTRNTENELYFETGKEIRYFIPSYMNVQSTDSTQLLSPRNDKEDLAQGEYIPRLCDRLVLHLSVCEAHTRHRELGDEFLTILFESNDIWVCRQGSSEGLEQLMLLLDLA